MEIPHQFDTIRPFQPEELAEVYERLSQNESFKKIIQAIFPDIPFEAFVQCMKQCKTNYEFQKVLCYPFLIRLVNEASDGCDLDAEAIDLKNRYTFVSNHRDIVIDSAFLNKMLIDEGSTTTCEIAIGDNLLSLPWVLDLIRINKSFIVKRGATFKQRLSNSMTLSDYIHFAINEKKEHIWIAQREGRAKDSDDRTQESVLKMLAMGGEGNPGQQLRDLNIVPLAISYEFDPCDFLKAAEMQLKRDNPQWKKSPEDDIISMKTGIMGYKGRIHYHCAPCINDFLQSLPDEAHKNEQYTAISRHIDQEIHSRYRMYPNNYVALDLLEKTTRFESQYTAEEKMRFEKYLAQQLAKINIPQKDENYLRERMLEMYANPLRNYLIATEKNK